MASPVIVDARGHVMGRLASTVAKELLSGQNVVLVRCDEAVISGKFIRNKTIFSQFLRKTMITNPRRGPKHLRSPSRMIWRTIRGMLPHKSPRGQVALEKLKVFEGIPAPYDRMKRMVIPQALAVTRIKPQRHVTLLGRLSSEVGWKYWDLVKELEEKRKVKAKVYYQRKKSLAQAGAVEAKKCSAQK